MTPPDWLTTRNGGLAAGLNDRTWLVTLDGHPQYRLVATTARGRYTCVLTQTNNGKRLDGGVDYPNAENALRGGLDELRTKLGW